jgi:hypothetical protein
MYLLRCALTRWLVAALAFGVVPPPAVHASQCLSGSGETACGFHCRASGGSVRCAQTLEGVCTVGSGLVVCWDPPSMLRRLFGRSVPAPSCLTSNGQTTCGYHCLSNYDRVQCAQTPYGACGSNEGAVVCADPPPQVLLAAGERTPPMTCLANYGKVACGYHCVANHDTVRCAETPGGTCRSERGTVFCWDPPADYAGVVFDPASGLACLGAIDGRACGFHCLTTTTHFACGSTRRESCKADNDVVTCSEPQ